MFLNIDVISNIFLQAFDDSDYITVPLFLQSLDKFMEKFNEWNEISYEQLTPYFWKIVYNKLKIPFSDVSPYLHLKNHQYIKFKIVELDIHFKKGYYDMWRNYIIINPTYTGLTLIYDTDGNQLLQLKNLTWHNGKYLLHCPDFTGNLTLYTDNINNKSTIKLHPFHTHYIFKIVDSIIGLIVQLTYGPYFLLEDGKNEILQYHGELKDKHEITKNGIVHFISQDNTIFHFTPFTSHSTKEISLDCHIISIDSFNNYVILNEACSHKLIVIDVEQMKLISVINNGYVHLSLDIQCPFLICHDKGEIIDIYNNYVTRFDKNVLDEGYLIDKDYNVYILR